MSRADEMRCVKVVPTPFLFGLAWGCSSGRERDPFPHSLPAPPASERLVPGRACRASSPWADPVLTTLDPRYYYCLCLCLSFSYGPKHKQCREHTGTVFLALVHFRYEFQDEGNYAAYGLSILPLPESDYLQKAERPPPPPENGHEGAAAAVAALSGPSSTDSGAATATKLCDAFLPGQASSVRSSVASTASSLSGVGPAASAGGARRGSGGDDFPGGGGGGDYQPLPPLGVMHQRVGSFHLQGRVDAWGSHDMGGAVSVGDVAKGLDGSLNSSRGSVPGGGDGFQDGIGGGGLILDSGRGGLSSGWGKASSAGR